MKVIIFGARGQDGTILAKQLNVGGHQVIGINRDSPISIFNTEQVKLFLVKEKPDRIYYFATCNRSSEDIVPEPLLDWRQSYKTHVEGWLNVLDGSRTLKPTPKILYASSPFVFGDPQEVPQKETTPLHPTCPYGITKCSGMQAGAYYRTEYGMFVAHAILFRHESIYRRPSFLSRKLLSAVIQAKQNPSFKCLIGDLSATADWGYAPEYTQAMQKILDLPVPDDFIVATGTEYCVADFAEALFAPLGLDWRNHLESKTSLLTKPLRRYCGSAKKLKNASGHQCHTFLPDLGRRLLQDSGILV